MNIRPAFGRMYSPTFGRSSRQALSASPLSHAEAGRIDLYVNAYRLLARSRTALIHAASLSPLLAAAVLYAALRALESLISSRSSSPSPNGGRPGGRFWASVMAGLYVRTKPLTSWNQGRIMYVHY
jgi:hypothetical protein